MVAGTALRRRLILAVDGGNSKTDAALIDHAGRLLAVARGPGSNRDGLGVAGSVGVLGTVIERARLLAGLDPASPEPPAVGVFCLAGVDLAPHERQLHRALSAQGWVEQVVVRNDSFAVLRAGTEQGWGVAVVCGAGDNCVGVAPNGRTIRFPALGPISGDFGGGAGVGLAALAAATRGRDGRGPRTALERLVPGYFERSRPTDVLAAIQDGSLPVGRLAELPPLVFAAAASDPVAAGIVERLADEAVALATAGLRRLRLVRREVDVVLGGGLFRSGHAPLADRVRAGVVGVAPLANVRVLHAAPVLGAALLGLERAGAGAAALRRASRELGPDRLPAGGDGLRGAQDADGLGVVADTAGVGPLRSGADRAGVRPGAAPAPAEAQNGSPRSSRSPRSGLVASTG